MKVKCLSPPVQTNLGAINLCNTSESDCTGSGAYAHIKMEVMVSKLSREKSLQMLVTREQKRFKKAQETYELYMTTEENRPDGSSYKSVSKELDAAEESYNNARTRLAVHRYDLYNMKLESEANDQRTEGVVALPNVQLRNPYSHTNAKSDGWKTRILSLLWKSFKASGSR